MMRTLVLFQDARMTGGLGFTEIFMAVDTL